MLTSSVAVRSITTSPASRPAWPLCSRLIAMATWRASTGLLAVLLVLGGIVAAAPRPAVQAADTAIEILSAEVGIAGTYKLGFWTPVTLRIAVPESAVADAARADAARADAGRDDAAQGDAEQVSGQLFIRCPDGDGTETLYELLPDPSENAETRVYRGLIRIGRLNAEAVVRWVQSGADGKSSRQWEWPLRDFARLEGLLSTDELLVVLGEASLFEGALARSREADQNRRLLEVDDPGRLPQQWLGWNAVDRLIVPGGSGQLAGRLTDPQVQAIETWVQQGGAVLYSLGGDAGQVLSDPDRLERRLLPGDFVKVVQHPDSAGFETYATANSQLLETRGESIAICQLSGVTGAVEAFEGRSPRDLPLVIRQPRGLGRVVFLAFDVNDQYFLQWEGRNRFLSKAFGQERGSGESGPAETRSGRVAHLGYSDLSGQLRSALDRFSGVQFVTFTTVAILIVLFLLCIGPGDYFLVQRVIGRMELTWLTFTGFVVLFSAVAVWAVGAAKGDRLQVNQLEVIDLDFATGEVRGGLWATLYSPRADRMSLNYAPSAERAAPVRFQDRWLGWQGLPGEGLGGMDSTIDARVPGQPYRSTLTREGAFTRNQLESVPLQVASTKTFFGRWRGAMIQAGTSDLQLDSRSDALLGQLTNPLDVPLSRAIILYGNWAYVVQGEVEPGGTIDIELDTSERTLDGFLTRRRVVDGRDITTPWDPADRDLPRIVEMLLFHEVAGGQPYTRLTQRLHAEFDLSDHLTKDRAVLLAETPAPVMDLQVDGAAATELYDQRWTFYRFVLPVTDPFERLER